MKTTTSEVRCDGCRDVIPVLRPDGSGTNLNPIYVTLRGPRIGHKKLDFCSGACFAGWCLQEYQTERREQR